MVRQFKFAAVALLLSVMMAPGGGVIFAAPQAAAQPTLSKPPSPPVFSRFALPETPPTLTVDGRLPPLASFEPTLFAQRGWGRGPSRNGGARAAVILGSVAAIAGGAVLVYANRPACRTNPGAGGCSYGTKVVGGAVLAGGVVAITVGALSWR